VLSSIGNAGATGLPPSAASTEVAAADIAKRGDHKEARFKFHM
jgi:hypothetical protein